MTMPTFRGEIEQITESVWTTVLGMPLVPASALRRQEAGPDTFAGRVCIDGAWAGEVVVICSRTMARRAAALMFEVPAAEASDSDMQDALNELTNMIGGNFKALLPESCRLSLPSAPPGVGVPVATAGTVQGNVSLESEGEPVNVVLIEHAR